MKITKLDPFLHELQIETKYHRSKSYLGEYPSMPHGESQRQLGFGMNRLQHFIPF